MKMSWLNTTRLATVATFASLAFAGASCQSTDNKAAADDALTSENVAGHADSDALKADASATSAAEMVTPAPELVPDETLTDSEALSQDEAISQEPVFGTASCDRAVIAKSQDAVGNPCETTESFMTTLSLSPRQIVYVQDHSMGAGSALAH